MTETTTIQMMREEVNLADLAKLPLKQNYRDGYSINTRSENVALYAVRKAGENYRVDLYATSRDGERYPVFINEGRNNGIGADGLIEMLGNQGLSLNEAIENYTFGSVRQDEIAFYQLEFFEEHHRR